MSTTKWRRALEFTYTIHIKIPFKMPKTEIFIYLSCLEINRKVPRNHNQVMILNHYGSITYRPNLLNMLSNTFTFLYASTRKFNTDSNFYWFLLLALNTGFKLQTFKIHKYFKFHWLTEFYLYLKTAKFIVI